jgi:hypothetical protein
MKHTSDEGHWWADLLLRARRSFFIRRLTALSTMGIRSSEKPGGTRADNEDVVSRHSIIPRRQLSGIGHLSSILPSCRREVTLLLLAPSLKPSVPTVTSVRAIPLSVLKALFNPIPFVSLRVFPNLQGHTAQQIPALWLVRFSG